MTENPDHAAIMDDLIFNLDYDGAIQLLADILQGAAEDFATEGKIGPAMMRAVKFLRLATKELQPYITNSQTRQIEDEQECRVVFTHDEAVRKWSTHVEGARNMKDACDAFQAVVLSCNMLNTNLLDKALITKRDDGNYEVTPAV